MRGGGYRGSRLRGCDLEHLRRGGRKRLQKKLSSLKHLTLLREEKVFQGDPPASDRGMTADREPEGTVVPIRPTPPKIVKMSPSVRACRDGEDKRKDLTT